MERDIRIKAGSPDNEVVLRNIIKLFTAEYGQNFLAQDIYNMQFWARRISTRFLSLLAFDHNRLISHLALQPEKNNTRTIQLLYPALDPEYVDALPELSEMAWQVITSQVKRHNWRSIFTLMAADDLKYQNLIAENFDMQPCAVFPNFFNTPQDKVHKHRSAVFYQRFFEHSSESPLYIPKKHREFCEALYAKLGLKRKFAKPSNKNSFAMPTDIRALESYRYHVQDFSHVYITPSLDFGGAVSYIKNSSNLLFVNSEDPRCPEFCNYLEEYGYSFSGITPALRGREAIVYSKLQDEDIKDPVAKTAPLLQYINEEYDSCSSLQLPLETQAKFGSF